MPILVKLPFELSSRDGQLGHQRQGHSISSFRGAHQKRHSESLSVFGESALKLACYIHALTIGVDWR